jgi:hypothetical protein
MPLKLLIIFASKSFMIGYNNFFILIRGTLVEKVLYICINIKIENLIKILKMSQGDENEEE